MTVDGALTDDQREILALAEGEVSRREQLARQIAERLRDQGLDADEALAVARRIARVP